MTDKKKQEIKKSPQRKYKIKKNLTLPVMKLALDKEYYIQMTEPVFIGKKVDDKKDEAVIANVIDCDTGELMQLLVPSVMQGVLHDNYKAPKFGAEKDSEGVSHTIEVLPGQHDYVDKIFCIIKRPKPSGKGYHPMSIQEVELED